MFLKQAETYINKKISEYTIKKGSTPEELLKIGRNNYVFIATHSQFMIDNKNKERHYIVTKPHNNTEVHQWNETKDLSDDEILRAAFGINVLNDFLSPIK